MKQRSKETKNADPKLQRQRKFMLMLPVLVIPFLTGGFWVLGGGQGADPTDQQASVSHGFNINLPPAHFDKRSTILDKLGFYQKAEMDSAKLAEKAKSDPYLAIKPIATEGKQSTAAMELDARQKPQTSDSKQSSPLTYSDSNEDKVFKKLDQLKKIINQPAMSPLPAGLDNSNASSLPYAAQHTNPDIERLERLMQAMKPTGDSTAKDPEMDRINGVLDKVLKIQHPEMFTQTQKAAPLPPKETKEPLAIRQGSETVAAMGDTKQAVDTTGGPLQPNTSEGFVAFDDNSVSDEAAENTIRAVISEDQTLVSGATVKLRLTQDAQVGGMVLPKDNFIYGTATLNNERLMISIKSVISDNSIYPVNWQVFDLDGMSGIFVPGAISRDVSKESAAEGINSVGVTGLDASLGAQAASAGIETVKTLFSKKIKLVRVSVKAGYEVLLKESKASS